MKTVAVIPCFNEEKFIGDIVSRVKKYVDAVIVVDDGSSDDTSLIAQDAGAQVVKHLKSKGAGAATRTGIEHAKELNADVVVTLDGDGQHKPEEIPILLEAISSRNADIVIGSRFNRKGYRIPKYRKIGIDIINWLLNVFSNLKIDDAQSGFRAYNKRFINLISIEENGFGFSVEVLIKARAKNLTIFPVPISCIYHEDGSTLNPVIHGITVALKVVKYRILELLNKF